VLGEHRWVSAAIGPLSGRWREPWQNGNLDQVAGQHDLPGECYLGSGGQPLAVAGTVSAGRNG
jgi:hypothetical protein